MNIINTTKGDAVRVHGSALQWVIFDLGDVLVKLNRGYRPPVMLQAPPVVQARLEAYFQDDFRIGKKEYSLNERFQLGQVDRVEFLRLIRAALVDAVTDEQIVAEFAGLLAGDNPEVLSIMAALRGQCRLACFTNTHAIHWSYIHEHYPWMKDFEVRASSHLLGYAKPDPLAYRALLGLLQAPPETCLFIDDRDVNVAGAQTVGIHAVQFRGADLLRADLRRFGLRV